MRKLLRRPFMVFGLSLASINTFLYFGLRGDLKYHGDVQLACIGVGVGIVATSLILYWREQW